MKRLRLLFYLFLLFSVKVAYPQSPGDVDLIPSFTTPDTVCVGAPVSVVNAIQGSTFYWNFCTGDASDAPEGFNQGNPGNNLSAPKFITLVRDSIFCYSFITSAGNSAIVRNYHGLSYKNAPISSTQITAGVFTPDMQGIQVIKDQGNWYGFVANGTMLLKMSFGSSITNNPSIIDIPFSTINQPTGLVIVKELMNWVGFALDYQNNELYRLDFGPSLNTNPAVTNLGNVGVLNGPTGLVLRRISGFWYMLVCNEGNSTLSRLEFGNSLTSTPTGTNLGNVGGLDHNTGITLINDCQSVNAYVINHASTGSPVVHLAFPDGIMGNVVSTTLPAVGGLDNSYGISEMVRMGDTIYAYVTNEGNFTLTKLFFPVCSASSIPSFTGGSTPPIFYYTAPGTYNIILNINEGGANSSTSCNKIVVVEPPDVELGPDRAICDGSTTTIAADTVYATYTWSNGETGNAITVDTSGVYWVKVSNQIGCETGDTIVVTLVQKFIEAVNKTLCAGEKYYAQGAWQTTTGYYTDSLISAAGCDSIIYTNLYVKAPVVVSLGSDTMFCPGNQFLLDATTPLAYGYTWQDGTTTATYEVMEAGTYWVNVNVQDCFGGDTIVFRDCPSQIWFPGAFTPNGDGLNDYFKPKGISIVNFHLLVFDRWGQQVFESKDMKQGWDGKSGGQYCEPGVYVYTAVYETLEPANETKKVSGSFSLIR